MAAAAPLVLCGTAPLPCTALISGAAAALGVLTSASTKDAASLARDAASQAAEAAASAATALSSNTAAVRASAAAAAMAVAGQSAAAARAAAKRAVMASGESATAVEWAVKHASNMMESLRGRIRDEGDTSKSAQEVEPRGSYEHLGPFSDRAAFLPCGNWPYPRPDGAAQASRLRGESGAREAAMEGAADNAGASSSTRAQIDHLMHARPPAGGDEAFFEAYTVELLKSSCGVEHPGGEGTPGRDTRSDVLQINGPQGGGGALGGGETSPQHEASEVDSNGREERRGEQFKGEGGGGGQMGEGGGKMGEGGQLSEGTGEGETERSIEMRTQRPWSAREKAREDGELEPVEEELEPVDEDAYSGAEGGGRERGLSALNWLAVSIICIFTALTLTLVAICCRRACGGAGGRQRSSLIKSAMLAGFPIGRLALRRAPAPWWRRAPCARGGRRSTASDGAADREGGGAIDFISLYDDTLEDETPRLTSCFGSTRKAEPLQNQIVIENISPVQSPVMAHGGPRPMGGPTPHGRPTPHGDER